LSSWDVESDSGWVPRAVVDAERQISLNLTYNCIDMLNCTTGSLPTKYLGFPISGRRLKMEAFGR
jgi:hypothetical protein